MKRILVTGGTGFIGNYVIHELLEQGHEVIVSSTSIERARVAKWFSEVNFIPLNLMDLDLNINYFRYFEEPEAMIHLAWEGLPNYKNNFHVEDNLPRHYSFLKNLIENGLRDLTVTGTCLEYGMQEGSLIENMETKPMNPYALAKDLLRKQLQQLQNFIDFNLKWVRLFYMYGKGQSSNSIFSQLDKALENRDTEFNMSGGMQKRDYLPVESVACNIVRISTQNNITGIINCSSGKPITIKKFVEDYLDRSGKSIKLNLGYYPYTDYEPMFFYGDNEKLKSII